MAFGDHGCGPRRVAALDRTRDRLGGRHALADGKGLSAFAKRRVGAVAEDLGDGERGEGRNRRKGEPEPPAHAYRAPSHLAIMAMCGAFSIECERILTGV